MVGHVPFTNLTNKKVGVVETNRSELREILCSMEMFGFVTAITLLHHCLVSGFKKRIKLSRGPIN
jgi:hypothetical protein